MQLKAKAINNSAMEQGDARQRCDPRKLGRALHSPAYLVERITQLPRRHQGRPIRPKGTGQLQHLPVIQMELPYPISGMHPLSVIALHAAPMIPSYDKLAYSILGYGYASCLRDQVKHALPHHP